MSARKSRAETIRLIELSMPWEDVEIGYLTTKQQAVFNHRKDALERYIKGFSLAEIKLSTTVGGNYLRKIIGRCLMTAPDGRPYGYRAMLPNYSIKTYSRKQSLAMTDAPRGAGLAGSLGVIFKRYPDIQHSLDLYISKKPAARSSMDPAHKFANRAKDVHREFIDLLNKYGHPHDEWPFTHKFRGSKTITNYVNYFRATNFEQTVRLIGGKGAVAHLAVGTGHTPKIKFSGLNNAWEIDAHEVSAKFVIGVTNAAGLVSVEVLKALHILAIIDPGVNSAVWFRVIYGADATAEDVVALIREALGGELPKPKAVIPNLVLKEGAGFPADLFPELRNAPPSVLRFDNALAHLADKVCYALRKQIGSIYDYGPPASFERRANIENLFKDFEQTLGQRMYSSTGTGPNGGGAENPGQAAKDYMIDSSILEQLTYVTLGNHNATPNAGLGQLAPLAAIRQRIAADNNHFLPVKIPIDRQNKVGTGLVREIRTVRGSIDKGVRPYINFESARYTSRHLQEGWNLIGQNIIIEIDESNIVVVYAYLENGEPLGPLTVLGAWSETPHSRKSRKFINQLKYKGVIFWTEGQNPCAVLDSYLKAQILESSVRGKDNRKAASELDRLRHERGRSSKDVAISEDDLPVSTPPIDTRSDPVPEPKREWVLPAVELDLFALIKKMK